MSASFHFCDFKLPYKPQNLMQCGRVALWFSGGVTPVVCHLLHQQEVLSCCNVAQHAIQYLNAPL